MADDLLGNIHKYDAFQKGKKAEEPTTSATYDLKGQTLTINRRITLGNQTSTEEIVYQFAEGVVVKKVGNGIINVNGLDYLGTVDIATGAFDGFYRNDYDVTGPEAPLDKMSIAVKLSHLWRSKLSHLEGM